MSFYEAAEKVWLTAVRLPALSSICWDDRVMQGYERPDAGLWDVAALVGHLMPESGMFAFLAAHRGSVFPDADWADLGAAAELTPSAARWTSPSISQTTARRRSSTRHGSAHRLAAVPLRHVCDHALAVGGVSLLL